MRRWLPVRLVLLAVSGLLSLACAMLVGAAIAQAPSGPDAFQVELVPDQEPITHLSGPPDADPLKLALGETLFSDTRLSADGTLACVSCHDIHSNGAGSGRPARDGSKPPFDTLSIFNASLNFRLDWRGKFRELAAQAEASLENPLYMKTSADEVALKLNHDPKLVADFLAAYGRAPDRENVLDALVTFERSLVTPGSRFDRWLGGDASALSASELEGYRLFKSFGCSSCHQGRNVGGNLFERQGVFHPLVRGPPEIVRVPSLRNVAATAPYFHDGSAATLQDAVRRMARAQLDRTLTDPQIESIVGFLQTLTGNYRGSPVTGAPR
ncbi:MAG: c-type cytochrome [Bradyrhizobium sp.]|uniref:cytochrome-c peroxidase n=1 Tax=Bradyrhizobium sp. TaxID=376 RepID=UPI001D7E6D7A|nr:cytochrome c peroxidase [Bradyrhizobium sp.]MBV9562448.1 c-type cytochrome [Bradyrhizobium sp.]